MIVNKVIYNKLRADREVTSLTSKLNITIDTEHECIRFINDDKGSSITLFTIANTMRYLKYTVDDLMSEIILKFGYRSALHVYMDKILEELDYL